MKSLQTITHWTIIWGAVGLMTLGCGSSSRRGSTPTAKVTRPSPTTPADPTAPTQPSPQQSTEPTTTPATPSEASPLPPIESTSVIDMVEEGRLYRRALRSYQRGEMSRVEEARDQLLQDAAYAPLGKALEALLKSSQGAHQEAMHIAEQLSSSDLMQTEFFVVAGEVFRQQHLLKDATACLRNAVQRNPGHAVAHRWLGAIHRDTGAMALAAEHFRAAARADASDLQSFIQSGHIHFAFHGYESAVEDFQQALRRDLDQVTEVAVRIGLADALLALERPEEAFEAVAPCDDIATVWAIRGECRYADGDLKQAAEFVDMALKESPTDRRAILLRCRLHLDQQQYEDAIGPLESLVASDPMDAEALEMLLSCVSRTSESQRANELERQWNSLQAFQKRLEELKLEAVDRPEDAQVRLKLAKACEEHGRVDDAIHWYEAAAGLDASLQSARDRIQQLNAPHLPPLEAPKSSSTGDGAGNL